MFLRKIFVGVWPKILRHFGMLLFHCIQRYIYSLDSLFDLGLFTGAAAALISYKIMIISLHSPLSIWGFILVWPCLFEFDLITLILLHWGLSSRKKGYKWGTSACAIFIMLLSSSFTSFYIGSDAEIKWESIGEVLLDRQYLSSLVTVGNGIFGTTFVLYALVGEMAVLLRLHLGNYRRDLCSTLNDEGEFDQSHGGLRRILTLPRVRVFLLFLFITLLLPPYPWRRMTATLGYDVIVAAFMIMKSNHPYRHEATIFSEDREIEGYPLKSHNYNPANDPYYISNLDQPVDEFIARALEGTEFTNIMHIVLESVGEYSFPYQDDGLLNQHIHSSSQLRVLEPINTQTITPFIASLAENTLSWHKVWTTVSFTHKSMIGYFCGMFPIPRNWAVESEPPTKWYQHCLPEIFRYMNLVTNTESEINAIFNNSRPSTTDNWETIHLQTMTGEWDNEKHILKSAGFSTLFDAESLDNLNGKKPYASSFGYFDEEGLDYLWKYIDHTRARVPKNRMYVSWMSSTTHSPFVLPPAWEEKNFKNYFEIGEFSKSAGPEDIFNPVTVHSFLNTLKWTDDTVRDIILGFRERGLEDETLFMIHGDHGIPFLGNWPTAAGNPHNEEYRIPFLLYNPRIRNPEKKKIEGNFYSLSIPTTILDLMSHTNSFKQEGQRSLASRFAANYEYAQSMLRPITETMRMFAITPGGGEWTIDNGRNLRCRFNLTSDHVRMLDYVRDPLELNTMESWNGVEGLIIDGAEGNFGAGTAEFLRAAYKRHEYMKKEIFRRYRMDGL